MSEEVKPQWQHCCEYCTYLGPHKWCGVEYDLYVCLSRPNEVKALFARFGNNADQMLSQPLGGRVEHEALFQARRQARLQGYIAR